MRVAGRTPMCRVSAKTGSTRMPGGCVRTMCRMSHARRSPKCLRAGRGSSKSLVRGMARRMDRCMSYGVRKCRRNSIIMNSGATESFSPTSPTRCTTVSRTAWRGMRTRGFRRIRVMGTDCARSGKTGGKMSCAPRSTVSRDM